MTLEELADRLVIGWQKYANAFDQTPNGTRKQILALLELSRVAEKLAKVRCCFAGSVQACPHHEKR